MDGILLSHREKQLKQHMFTVLNSKEPVYGSFKQAVKTKSMMTSKRPERHIEAVIEAVGVVADVCLTNKIRNIDRFCAGAAEVLCDKNSLSSFGARIVLDEQVQKSKFMPSISELDNAAQLFVQSLSEFETWQEHKKFSHNQKLFLDRMKESGIELNGINKWFYVFPYTELARLDSENWSLPRSKNVLLYLLETMKAFYDSAHNAFDGRTPNIEDICKESILSQTKKQFQKIDDLGIGMEFLTPSQWKAFDWKNVKLTSENWDDPFQPFNPILFRITDVEGFEPSILEHLKVLTKQHFEMEEMFE